MPDTCYWILDVGIILRNEGSFGKDIGFSMLSAKYPGGINYQ
jgi:hypothetical protein